MTTPIRELVPPSTRERPFCSDAARLRGDENAATAARVDVWLLVEFPGTWGRNPLQDAQLPDAVRVALERALKEIPRSRLVFIRRRLDTREGCRVYVSRSAPNTAQVMRELPSLDDVAMLPFAELATTTAQQEMPLVLVCTHGQHDSCCGRRGFPLYDALRQRPDLDVWQCSHIGGDRFAANALVLPWGQYYGPVEARDADAFAETILADDIYLAGYRGRCSMSRLAQAGETFVRRLTGMLRRDALRVISREPLPDERTRVRLRDVDGAIHEVVIEPYVSADAAFVTCGTTTPGAVRQLRLVDYHVTRV